MTLLFLSKEMLVTLSLLVGPSLPEIKIMNDNSQDENCPIKFKGAWWYNAYHASNLNGLYHHGRHPSYADGVSWKTWKGYYYSLKRTEMKIRPASF